MQILAVTVGKLGKCKLTVVDHNRRGVRSLQLLGAMLTDHASASARECHGNKIVTVRAFSAKRNERRFGIRLARIGANVTNGNLTKRPLMKLTAAHTRKRSKADLIQSVPVRHPILPKARGQIGE